MEEVAGGFRLLTRRQFAPWIRRLDYVPPQERLSAPAMETLAVVAYRQPVLRSEIEAIRGVSCGEILRQLGSDPETEGWSPVAGEFDPRDAEEIPAGFPVSGWDRFECLGFLGKGGMGPSTLRALQDCGAVYVNATGGAASLIASTVKDVIAVHKLDEFGVPEAFWVIRVEEFPAVVTMDSRGQSIHSRVAAVSEKALNRLIDA